MGLQLAVPAWPIEGKLSKSRQNCLVYKDLCLCLSAGQLFLSWSLRTWFPTSDLLDNWITCTWTVWGYKGPLGQFLIIKNLLPYFLGLAFLVTAASKCLLAQPLSDLSPNFLPPKDTFLNVYFSTKSLHLQHSSFQWKLRIEEVAPNPINICSALQELQHTENLR